MPGPDTAIEGDRTVVEPPGENTEPLTVPAVGVIAPDSLGEPGFCSVGRDVVDWKSVDSEAFERRYGRRDMDPRGDFAFLDSRCLGGLMFDPESESCGVCSGSSGGGIRVAGG